MLNQALTRHKKETRHQLQAIVEQQRVENEQYRLTVQTAIANQFTNLTRMLLQNLQ